MINQNPLSFYVLIVAGGTGSRFGGDVPKQFLPVHGKPLIQYSIEAFQSVPGFAGMCVVADSALVPAGTPCAAPGKDRKESVLNGLKYFSNLKEEDIILIHDAARPCILLNDINKLIKTLKVKKSASLVSPLSDTIRRENGENVSRDGLYAMLTPQGFRYGDILKAHENADPAKTYTDDVALALEAGIEVAFIPGSRSNIKLTTPEDLSMIETLLRPAAPQTLVGTGFDVHALENNPARPLMLCGIEIPSNLALTGHSDADVGLHALTDALLGAIGMGDIGDHFPPSNPAFKDMDSALFLQKAVSLAHNKGAQIINADITLICEEPKIGPHKVAMKARVAELLGLPSERVNIKATTTEQLGFTGRREGIAAQAAVSVRV